MIIRLQYLLQLPPLVLLLRPPPPEQLLPLLLPEPLLHLRLFEQLLRPRPLNQQLFPRPHALQLLPPRLVGLLQRRLPLLLRLQEQQRPRLLRRLLLPRPFPRLLFGVLRSQRRILPRPPWRTPRAPQSHPCSMTPRKNSPLLSEAPSAFRTSSRRQPCSSTVCSTPTCLRRPAPRPQTTTRKTRQRAAMIFQCFCRRRPGLHCRSSLLVEQQPRR